MPLNGCYLLTISLTLETERSIGEVGAILIGFWYVFFYTDYTILDKLFELCPFMQTAIPHENHIDGFFQTHTQSQKLLISTSFLPYQNSPTFLPQNSPEISISIHIIGKTKLVLRQ